MDVYKLQSVGKLDQWKKVASVPAQSTSQFLWECKCFMVCNDEQLVLVNCHANNQDLPSIFPSYVGTGTDLKTNELAWRAWLDAHLRSSLSSPVANVK